jgi:uncharacterized protein DUF6790
MSFLIFVIFALLVVALHIYRDRQALAREGIAKILLLWLLVIGVGLGGIMAFIGHTVFASSTAASIGWPAGNPFQTEVAVANLAVGVLGVLCYWLRDNFWVATVIVNSVFQLGDAVVHINQIVVVHNYNPNNAGIVLYTDILVPLILIALLISHRYISSRYERRLPPVS